MDCHIAAFLQIVTSLLGALEDLKRIGNLETLKPQEAPEYDRIHKPPPKGSTNAMAGQRRLSNHQGCGIRVGAHGEVGFSVIAAFEYPHCCEQP